RIVAARARHLDGQVLDVIRLRIVAAKSGAAADGVDGPVAVHRHVTARRPDVAAFAHLAGGNIIAEENILRLASVIQLTAGLVDWGGHDAFLLFEDAETATKAGRWIVVAKMAAGKAVGVLAVLRSRVENFMGLLAGKPHSAIGTDDDLGVDLALGVDAAA